MAREYFFTVEYPGAETKISPKLEEREEQGVSLYFFRYGYFLKNSLTDLKVDYYAYTENEGRKKYQKKTALTGEIVDPYEKRKFHCDDNMKTFMQNCVEWESVALNSYSLPTLENFYIGRTFLEQGYLYILGKNNRNFFREYEVTEYGKIKPIVWRKGNDGDCREPDDAKEYYDVIVPPAEYYIAFARTQWSRRYIQNLLSDEEALKNRFQLIDCRLYVNMVQTSDEIVSPDYITVVCPPQHKQFENFIKLSELTIREYNSKSPNRTQKIEGNEIFDKVFITLKDPIGCADDITLVIDERIGDLKALVASLPSGKSPESIKEEWKKNPPKNGELLTNVKEPTDISTMFFNALSVYHFVYNKNENAQKYNDNVNKEMLEGILAVTERKRLRIEITKYRNDLVEFLESNEYPCHFDDFYKGKTWNAIDGCLYCMEHIKILDGRTENIDGHLYLNKERYPYTEKHKRINEFLGKVYYTDPKNNPKKVGIPEILNPFIDYDLLYDDQSLDIVLTVDLANKVSMFFNSLLDLYIQSSLTSEKKIEFIFKQVKALKGGGFHVRQRELNQFLKENGYSLKKPFPYSSTSKSGKIIEIPEDKRVRVIEHTIRKEIHNSKGGRVVEKKQIEIRAEGEVIVPPKRTPEQVKGAKILFNNPFFRKFLIKLQFLNISCALYQLQEEFSVENSLNTSGVTFDLLTAYAFMHKSNLLALKAEEKAIKKIEGNISRFTKVSNGITAVYCGWESWESYKMGDKKAAGAFAISSIAFAALIFAPETLGWSLFLGALAIGSYAIAYWLKGDDFQVYFNNSWFNANNSFEKEEKESPYRYINRVYNHRKSLMSNNKITEPWKKNINSCYQYFLDLLNKTNIEVKGKIKKIQHNYYSLSDGKNHHFTGSMDTLVFRIPFFQFQQILNDEKQFDLKIFTVYQKEIEEVYAQRISEIKIIEDFVGESFEKYKYIEATITMPIWLKDQKDKYEKDVRLLFACRLQISNDYFPYAYLGKDRYLAVLSPTYLDRWDYNKSLTFFNEYTCDLSEDSEQNIGTLKELKQWCKSIKQLPK
jgi:hypothetical protein